MNDWLDPNFRPIWDKSHPEKPFGDCHWVSNESKEDTMTKKAANQTTIDQTTIDMTANNEQEGTTMTENTNVNANTESKEDTTMTKFDIPRKANGKYDFVADKAKHAEIREATKLGRIKGIELTHAIEGKKLLGGLTNDPAELELLAKAAKKFGWSGRVLTATQAGDYLGTPNPEYTGHGWLVKNKPYTNREGRTTQFMTIVYPIEAFVFATEDGEPALDEQKALEDAAKKAKRVARKANKQLKNANDAAGIKTPRRRNTSRKPKTETINDQPVAAASPDVIAELQRSNEELRAMNAELLKRFDALSAFMIANQ